MFFTVDRQMTRDEALEKLRALHGPGDEEINHAVADQILLAFIGDAEIIEAFDAIRKWYA